MTKFIEPAEHLPAWLGEPVDAASAMSGLPSDQLRLLICLLAALPLGWFFRALPGKSAKHLFSVVVGAFFSWFVVGNTFVHVPLSALLVYVLVQVLPRRMAPTVVFVTTVGWLSALHIWRLYVDYMGWSLDATMLLMIWTAKASMFAYNVADGQALNAGLKLSERESTHIFRAERAITQMPSLLEYFSYVFFFGGVLVGPCFEAKEFFDFVDGSLQRKHGLASLPSSILPSLKCALLGVSMYAGMFIFGLYPLMGVVNSEAFGTMPFLQRFTYFWIAITSSRFRYYFAWYFGDAGCVATGFGFNGVKKNKAGEITGYKWDRVSNCNVLAVESAPHMSDVTNNWNMGVNNWLKNYVYFRVEAPRFIVKAGLPQKSFMNLVTKVTSAFWHGFYPSYYVFFIGAWLAGEMDEALRASFEPADSMTPERKKARAASWWKGPTNLYELLSWTCCIMVLNFWGVTFVLLRADYAWAFAKNMYFLGVVVPVVVVALCRTVFRRKRAKREAPAAISVTPGAAVASPTPSGSPPAQVVSAVHISSASPLAPLPTHDVLPAPAPARVTRKSSKAEPAIVEAEDDADVGSPADRVKQRPRRSRSNKAE